MTARLVAYRDLEEDPVVRLLDVEDGSARTELLFALAGPVAEAVAQLVVGSTGPFAMAARQGLDDDDPRVSAAAAELDELFLRTSVAAAGMPRIPVAAGVSHLPPRAARLVAALAADVADGRSWSARAVVLADFHRSDGTGALATSRVLAFRDGALRAVERPDPIDLDDLIGFEAVRAPLLEDLERFQRGGSACDALLHGRPGTGKSATVRAAARRFADDGLRLVQLDREELLHLPDLMASLAGSGPRCLVFVDDLVLDDAGRFDRALRAALEGGVDERPANVLVWVTSNRVSLIGDTFSNRQDEVDAAEATAERSALAQRFGRRVRFGLPDLERFLEIAEALVARELGRVPDDVRERATLFARLGHGLTPRTARQFALAYRPPVEAS